MFTNKINEQIKNKKSFIINIVWIFLYAIFTLIVVLHHEIWADEAQAWVVVRDLDILGIIRHVRTEGHPLLWYFSLLPLAKLNLSVLSMQILNWLLVVISVGILIFKSPFHFFSKIAITLSSGFLYWYVAIARSYCLIPLFMFLIASFYQKQKEHPFIYAFLIIALANTHVIMLGFCTALAIIFLWNNRDKKSIIAAGLMFLSFAFLTGYLWNSQNENIIVQNSQVLPFPQCIFFAIERSVHSIYNSTNWIYYTIFCIFTLYAVIITAVKNKSLLFVYIFSTIFQFCIYIFIWGQLPQRTYTLLLVIIFCFWIIFKNLDNKLKITTNIIIALTFLLSVPKGFDFIKKDIKESFSDGYMAAKFIQRNIPEDSFIVSNYPLTTVSISAYLPQNKGKWKFFSPNYNDFYSYSKWDQKLNPSFTPLPLAEYLKTRKEIYVIMSAGSFYDDLIPIYASSDKVFNNQEKFAIYHIVKRQN